MHKIEIIVYCPACCSSKIVKNGIKKDKQQNYLCTNCRRQFVHDYFLKNFGSKSYIDEKILLMICRGVGVRDIAIIENISVNKVLSVVKKSDYKIVPKLKHYKYIEIDEFWTYVQNKKIKFG